MRAEEIITGLLAALGECEYLLQYDGDDEEARKRALDTAHASRDAALQFLKQIPEQKISGSGVS